MLRQAVEAFRGGARTAAAAEWISGLRLFPKDWLGWVRLGIVIGALLAGAIVAAAYALSRVVPPLPPSVPLIGETNPPPLLTTVDEQRLLERFQPILHFAPGEYWAPVPVSVFLSDAVVEHSDGTRLPTKPTDETLPRGEGYRLDLETCRSIAGPRCYEGLAGSLTAQPRVLYGRLWRNETGEHRSVAYVLQYWLFYYFDDWRNSQENPTIWQMHEGDWEDVSIGINRSKTPIYAGYSQHCGGHFRLWTKLRHEGNHPDVYVALGSHANYFAPGVYSTPLRCIPSTFRPLVARLHLKDVAGTNDPEGPGHAGARVLAINAATPWLSFEGPWGESQQIVWIDKRKKQHHHAIGTSPVGPAQQTNLLWTEPAEQTRYRWPEDLGPAVPRPGG